MRKFPLYNVENNTTPDELSAVVEGDQFHTGSLPSVRPGSIYKNSAQQLNNKAYVHMEELCDQEGQTLSVDEKPNSVVQMNIMLKTTPVGNDRLITNPSPPRSRENFINPLIPAVDKSSKQCHDYNQEPRGDANS